ATHEAAAFGFEDAEAWRTPMQSIGRHAGRIVSRLVPMIAEGCRGSRAGSIVCSFPSLRTGGTRRIGSPESHAPQRNHLQVTRDWMITAKKRVEVSPAVEGPGAEILTAEALEFLSDLHRRFNPTRLDLLRRRVERQALVDRGKSLDFPKQNPRIREDSWTIAPVPADLIDRRVEITGPTD